MDMEQGEADDAYFRDDAGRVCWACCSLYRKTLRLTIRKLSDRVLNIEEFFDGQVVATGQFQDIFGTVRRRFDVDIHGTWDGETLTLGRGFRLCGRRDRTAYLDG